VPLSGSKMIKTKIKQANLTKILATMIATSACGTEINNNFYGPNGEEIYQSADFDNSCQSPLYGAHLWNILKCESGAFMAEDCSIRPEGRVRSGDSDPPDVTYRRLDILISGEPVLRFNPSLRFVYSAGPTARNVNRLLDQYRGRGFVLEYIDRSGLSNGDGCHSGHVDDCVFMREETPINESLCVEKYPLDRY